MPYSPTCESGRRTRAEPGHGRPSSRQRATLVLPGSWRFRIDLVLTSNRSSIAIALAVVHRYLRTDGTLGASGRPDPKRLREGGILYVADPEAELDI
jgi:hypothetical protein